jgi:hypothetical protein
MAKTSCKGEDIVFGFNELSTPVKAIISLALVLLLVVVAGLILRRITGGRIKFPGQGARARQPRLGIVDVFEMDRQRQLVLLRRDNVEHLILIGGPNDVLVESTIVRSQPIAQTGDARLARDVASAAAIPRTGFEVSATACPAHQTSAFPHR